MSDERRDAEQTPEKAAEQASERKAGSVSERVTEASEQAYHRPRTFGQDLKKEYKQPRKGNLAMRIGGLAVLVVVIAVVVMLVQRWTPEPEEMEVIDTSVPIMEHERASIDSVTVHVRGDEPYVVRTVPDSTTTQYTVDGIDSRVKLTQYMLGDAYSTGIALSGEGIIEENAQDLSAYGLDDPTSSITFHFTDGTEKTVLLGSKLPSGIGWYVCIKDENTVYRVSSYNGSRMTHTSKDIRDLNLMDSVTNENVDYVMINRRDGETLEMRQESSAVSINMWKILQPYSLEASSEAVLALAAEVAAVSLKEYVDTPEDYTPYGLEEPAAICMVKDTEGNRIYYHVGDYVEDDHSLRYIRVVGADEVFTTQASSLAFLETATVTQVVDRFAAIINIANVDSVDLTYENREYRLSITREEQYDEDGSLKMLSNGAPNYLEKYYIDGLRVDESPFKRIYQSMISVQVRGELTGDVTASPTARFTFHFNNGAESSTMEFIPYQKDFYAINQNGAMLFFTTRDVVDGLEASIEFAKTLPKTFEDAAIDSVEIRYSNGEIKTLERAEGMTLYCGVELGEDRFANAYGRMAGVSLQETSLTGANTEPVFSITYHYNDGRPSVTVEYRESINSTYLISIAGIDGYFAVNQRSILGEIEYFDSWIQ